MSQGACSLGPAQGILGLVVEFLFWEGRPGRLRSGFPKGLLGDVVQEIWGGWSVLGGEERCR